VRPLQARLTRHSAPLQVPKTGEGPSAKGSVPSSAQAPEGAGISFHDNTADVSAITNKRAFGSVYKLGKKLGEGTFSVVREATHVESGERVAVKCITKSGLSADDDDALKIEVAVMYELRHPNIVRFYDFFDEKKHYYLVTELLEGGELFDRIVEKEFYSEDEARRVIQTVCEAIGFCHQRQIVHRDLKPENILLTSKRDDAVIKIADFGFAKKVQGKGLTTACGTPGYVAPEILTNQHYGTAVDMWSIGVIAYILLCGYPPFHDENQRKLFKMIERADYQFDSPDWDPISAEAKDLISNLLVVDPRKRFTCRQVLNHRWITGSVPTTNLATTVTKLKEFNARRKWKKGVNAVRAGVRMKMLMTAARESPTPST